MEGVVMSTKKALKEQKRKEKRLREAIKEWDKKNKKEKK